MKASVPTNFNLNLTYIQNWSKHRIGGSIRNQDVKSTKCRNCLETKLDNDKTVAET